VIPRLRGSNAILWDYGVGLSLGLGGFALTLVFGPPMAKHASAYDVARAIAPIEAWGLVILATSAAKLASLFARTWLASAWVASFSAFFAIIWAGGLAANAVQHHGSGIGGVFIWSMVAWFHLCFGRVARREMSRA
jgi:hypothetical protein